MQKIHYIMPMAGRGSRFKEKGFDFPKPLIEIYGKPFFYWATQSIRRFIDLESVDFVILQEHIDRFGIDARIKEYFPEARIHVLQEVTEGAVITGMKGVVDIEDDLPVLFNDCDHLFKSSEFNAFIEQGHKDVDGILLTFTSTEDKYSFVGKDEDGNVICTVEKEAISDEAICGAYYFKNKNVFLENADKYLKNCDYNEFFMSGIYNIMIKNGLKVNSMGTDYHVSFGVPEEYEEAKIRKEYLELEG